MVKFKLPIKVYNEANSNDHWAKKNARRQSQKMSILLLCPQYFKDITPPCKIKLTRISPRKLDKLDNLPYAFKGIIDAIYEIFFPGLAIGRADNNTGIEIEFDQKKGLTNEFGLEIEAENL